MTLVLVRNSERARFKDCRQAWHWGYELGLESKRRKGALTFGTLAHSVMEGRYPPGKQRGPRPVEIFEQLWMDDYHQAFEQWDDEGNRIPAYDLGVAMMLGYEERWGEDDHIQMVAPEQAFQVDIYDKRGDYLATLVGRFDGLGLNLRTGRYFVFEHKTAKSIQIVRINSRYGEQGLSYWWAANHWLHHQGILKPGQHVDGILYNWLRKALPDERPQNAQGHRLNKPSKDALQAECASQGVPTKGTVEALSERLRLLGVDPAMLGEPSKNQPPPLFDRQEIILGPPNLAMFEKRVRRELFDMQKVRERRLPIYKNPGDHCGWCAFRDVCELHEMGGEYRDMLDMDFKPWDPYSDHELLAEKG